ncbi:MAG: PASTA domain-containing protein [Clostridia bacterium]|nr:PASTA domain-containing protein [Clostridia bacterium]
MKASKINNDHRTRLLVVFGFFVLLFVLLIARLGWIQIIKADEYAQKALKQQTIDSSVSALRGEILDSTGQQLAASVTKNTIWVRPSSVNKNGKSDLEIEANAKAEAATLAAILNLDEKEVLETITTTGKTIVKVKKYVDAATAAKIREEKLVGIEIVEDSSRSYPFGTFASHIVGFTNDDNEGQGGLELYYDRLLSGVNGRYITRKDKNKSSLVYASSKYYEAEDGYTVVTTIDEHIQYMVEQRLDEYKESTGASRIICIMMEPKTGRIIAMAQTNDYDPNNPRAAREGEEEAYAAMTDEEKLSYWYKLWRCFAISDTYEPGSTFKLITTSIALDTGVTRLGETFTCNGTIKVADRTLKCWYYPRVHGVETLEQAVGNSCNPVMVQLIQRMGLKQYYEGLDAFGLTRKTGVDYPGEGSNIIYDDSDVGPVELATMSYGQGISVTPISAITAISSLANGGYVMKPHFLDKVIDSNGNIVEEFEPEITSVSVSAQTAKDMLNIMEKVVSEGGGGSAKIAGYRIGGKTGTASKPTVGGYSDTDFFASFIGVAPVDDPQFVVLVLTDSPKGRVHGSEAAAPCAKLIMQDVLQYLNIQPQYSDAQKKALASKKTTVPDVTEKALDDAIGRLAGLDLTYQLSPALVDTEGEIIIVDQFPKAGEEVLKNSAVTLYYEVVQKEEE